jgi:XTP/dITP diphosphohydrolase
MRTVVLASNNAGKLRELNVILAPLGFDLRPQRDFTQEEAAEPYGTFIENALTKARFAAKLTGHAALADDSGICVPALGNAPGVISAHFAQTSPEQPKDDLANNYLLIERLRGAADRRAFYVCVLVFVQREDDPMPIIAEGFWHGRIVDQPRGTGGFGYDPHFEIPSLHQTAAEVSKEYKNAVSHRAQASVLLVEKMRALGIV